MQYRLVVNFYKDISIMQRSNTLFNLLIGVSAIAALVRVFSTGLSIEEEPKKRKKSKTSKRKKQAKATKPTPMNIDDQEDPIASTEKFLFNENSPESKIDIDGNVEEQEKQKESEREKEKEKETEKEKEKEGTSDHSVQIIEELNLMCNDIRNQGAKLIGMFISTNRCSLKRLDLGHNDIESKGI